MRRAARRSFSIVGLACVAAALTSAPATAAPHSATAPPKALWAVEVDARSVKSMTPARLASLRRARINTLVVDPARVRGRALKQLRSRAARAGLRLIVPTWNKKGASGIVFARSGRQAAALSSGRGSGLVVVRVSSPAAAAALRSTRSRRVLALARLAPHPRSAPQAWVGAIRAAHGSSTLDLGVTGLPGRTQALNAYLQLLAEPGSFDVAPPTPPALLTQGGASGTSVDLVWGPSSDDVGVAGYELSSDGAAVGTTTGTSHTIGSLACGRSYRISVVAKDGAGRRSSPALALASTTGCVTAPTLPLPDLVPPTQPGNVRVLSTVASAIAIAWNSSIDSVGVAGYRVFRNGAEVGTTAATSFSFTGLTCGTGYLFQVEAYDPAGNRSARGSTSAVTSACAPLPPPLPLPELVASYGFEEASGSAVGDSSGNGNAGTIAGAARTAAGRFGRAVGFDGVNDWITVPDSSTLDLYNGMTVEAWVKPDSSGGWETGVLKESTDDLVYALYTGATAGRPRGQIRTGSHSRATGPSALPAGQWSHLATTWDGTTVRLYVNGTQVASTAASGTLPPSASPLRIGGNDIWDEWFDGTIDEVRVYSVARSSVQIAADMNTPVAGGGPPDLVPPTQPGNLRATGTSETSVSVAWDASTDSVGVTGYGVYRNGTLVGSTASGALTYTFGSLTCATTYSLEVDAFDAAGNRSAKAALSAATADCPPSPPPPTSTTTATTAAAASSASASSASAAASASASAATPCGCIAPGQRQPRSLEPGASRGSDAAAVRPVRLPRAVDSPRTGHVHARRRRLHAHRRRQPLGLQRRDRSAVLPVQLRGWVAHDPRAVRRRRDDRDLLRQRRAGSASSASSAASSTTAAASSAPAASAASCRERQRVHVTHRLRLEFVHPGGSVQVAGSRLQGRGSGRRRRDRGRLVRRRRT